MKIKKYIKTGSNKYKVILENDESIILYEDVILKFELLLKKEIEDLCVIKNYNEKFSLYDKTLGYISKKLRCEKEIRNYLSNYTTNQDDIDNIIKKLYDNKILDNKLYIKNYINDKIYLTLEGPNRIKNDLINLGFDSYLVEDELIEFNQELIQERINKYINKQLKVNKKSLYVFKNKMLFNLINLGYENNDILKVLNKVSLDEDNLKSKEEEKLRKKYSRKYDGYELENIIKRKLFEKGYRD